MAQMKNVGEEIVRSYDERQRRLKEIQSQTSQLLKGATELLEGFREVQGHVRDDVAQARGAWRKAMSSLQARKREHAKKNKKTA